MVKIEGGEHGGILGKKSGAGYRKNGSDSSPSRVTMMARYEEYLYLRLVEDVLLFNGTSKDDRTETGAVQSVHNLLSFDK
ncbi:hypothetical protein NL676_038503 [Syzygium grande]|nr:hypothetical protein NL676_038503 [Syzygium grande]